MPKGPKKVNVTFSGTTATCNPDPVTVNNSTDNGIEWDSNTRGYTFTGVQIDGNDAPTEDFGTPVIGTDPSGNSTMTVSDDFADYDDHTYTLLFTTPSGEAGSFDPTIKNRN